jgi:tRNA-specific 2-thiouridylase
MSVMKRVIVGMSGGVDSSVSAYLLKEEGYDVEGVSFILWEARSRINPRACCSLEAIEEAKATADVIGIRHRAVDVREDFLDSVIDPFIEDYLHGRTPNPCVLCNLTIKFPYLLREADRAGAQFIATGHYARIERTDDRHLLKKGVDATKDQSYFLYVLEEDMMKRLIFPLGQFTKERVREIAQNLNLPAVRRPESVEICFIEDDYTCFIKNVVPAAEKEGPIIGPDGLVLGTHRGIYKYTIGQRRGLNISFREPLYVVSIDAEKNTLYVGTRESVFRREVSVGSVIWLVEPKSRVSAKIRSVMKDQPAELIVEDSGNMVRLVFDEPQLTTAPGQSAVFYDGDVILGGGVVQ